jgi:hypothetical protein
VKSGSAARPARRERRARAARPKSAAGTSNRTKG